MDGRRHSKLDRGLVSEASEGLDEMKKLLVPEVTADTPPESECCKKCLKKVREDAES